jgi:hypothetical protein
MVQIDFDFVAENKPHNLPSAEVIIQQCNTRRAQAKAANPNPNVDIRGVSLLDESNGGAAYAWVKVAPSVSMAEARTQHYIAQVVNGNADAAVRVPYVYLSFESRGWGYIVMEFIDGVTCGNADASLVAAAVTSLINIQAPTVVPGPVGGGHIYHNFFIDRESSVSLICSKNISTMQAFPLRLGLSLLYLHRFW